MTNKHPTLKGVSRDVAGKGGIVGHTVRVVAEATEVDDTTLACDVTAYDGERLVGQGRQVQRVLPKSKLKALIERAK